MRYRTIVAASAVAAAAAAIPSGAAWPTTPDWLTLASVQTGERSLVPFVCGEQSAGTALDSACQSTFGTDAAGAAEAVGRRLPEAPEPAGHASLSAADVDLRDFAKWEVCGVAVASETGEVECDDSNTGEDEPVRPDRGVPLVNIDATGALDWSVCGITVLGNVIGSDC
ncbi:hypothetical protein [Glycomyces xiaoerkulensis]|uniref:hypothetical protein n=1 Tax=Glycomyces xiaoerkulensis TaxID=2038139 RepID=UPI0012FFEAD7|nr:hypothetical protein [Glycomyces xiaoerkulensis]